MEFCIEQSNTAANPFFQNTVFLFQTNLLNLLPLPKDFVVPGFGKSRITFNNTETNFIPDIDKMMNEYSFERCKILFTVRFVETVNQQFSLFTIGNNDTLEYGVTFYMKINNSPVGESSENIRQVLSFYLESLYNFMPLVSKPKNNLLQLNNELQKLESTFLEKIKKVQFLRKGQKNQTEVGEKSAKWFIDFVNKDIEKNLNDYFTLKKAQIIQNLPDAVINDSRFKMSLEDVRWDDYDATIKTEVSAYNTKFNNVGGYKPLDWRLVKAMVWTEIFAGPKGDKVQWETYPMQIGRFSADAGASVVKNGRENSDLITTAELRSQLQKNITGHNNIRAGIAYLLTIAIRNKVGLREVIENPNIETYRIQASDKSGLDAIAKRLGTTTDNILQNSGISKNAVLKIGQEIKYQKARSERYIQGWQDWLEAVKDYNGGGDANYMEKINRAYQIIKSRY